MYSHVGHLEFMHGVKICDGTVKDIIVLCTDDKIKCYLTCIFLFFYFILPGVILSILNIFIPSLFLMRSFMIAFLVCFFPSVIYFSISYSLKIALQVLLSDQISYHFDCFSDCH